MRRWTPLRWELDLVDGGPLRDGTGRLLRRVLRQHRPGGRHRPALRRPRCRLHRPGGRPPGRHGGAGLRRARLGRPRRTGARRRLGSRAPLRPGVAEPGPHARGPGPVRGRRRRWPGASLSTSPTTEIPGAYLLYDGVHRRIPALFVGRDTGRPAPEAQERDETARLILEAVVEDTVTHNVLGLVPGRPTSSWCSSPTPTVRTGSRTTAPKPSWRWRTTSPRSRSTSCPRSILVLLSTGHFAIEEAWGRRGVPPPSIATDLVPRIAAVLSLEHLGALARAEDYPDRVSPRLRVRLLLRHPAPRGDGRGPRRHGPRRGDRLPRAAALRPRSATRPTAPPGRPTARPSGTSPDCPRPNFITGPGYLFNVEPVGATSTSKPCVARRSPSPRRRWSWRPHRGTCSARR